MRRHTILAALVAATAALAAQPAAASTPDPINPPELSQPPDMCFETVQFAVCSSDVGPLTQRALSDPAGTAVGLAGLVVHIVCYGNEDLCEVS